MAIFMSPDGLPDKILRHVTGEYLATFVAAFKTNIKPNATIPILWAIIYNQGIFLCNTHATRGIYRDIKTSDIDSIKIKTSEYTPPVIQIIFKDILIDDFYIELPKGTSLRELSSILEKLNVQILQA